jgi:tRNA (mo5U34)-methyltransferase
MLLYQRACLVLANEGVTGLSRRIARRIWRAHKPAAPLPPPISPELRAAREAYAREIADFNARAAARGYGDLEGYYWYHTIDLGNGLVTPGDYDFRDSLPAFHFPSDMTGMNVLDVGAATGFFSFEFERRGANVVSVDLPSMAEWDVVRVEREPKLAEFAEVSHRHLVAPFEFCHKVLRSRVRRVHYRIYDMTPEKLGVDGFDLVYLGDVLPHLFSPLAALDVVAPLCKGKLVISQDLWGGGGEQAGLLFTGGNPHQGDGRSWWRPNRLCLERMLRRVGFKKVVQVGRHMPLSRGCWMTFDRPVFHATR